MHRSAPFPSASMYEPRARKTLQHTGSHRMESANHAHDACYNYYPTHQMYGMPQQQELGGRGRPDCQVYYDDTPCKRDSSPQPELPSQRLVDFAPPCDPRCRESSISFEHPDEVPERPRDYETDLTSQHSRQRYTFDCRNSVGSISLPNRPPPPFYSDCSDQAHGQLQMASHMHGVYQVFAAPNSQHDMPRWLPSNYMPASHSVSGPSPCVDSFGDSSVHESDVVSLDSLNPAHQSLQLLIVPERLADDLHSTRPQETISDNNTDHPAATADVTSTLALLAAAALDFERPRKRKRENSSSDSSWRLNTSTKQRCEEYVDSMLLPAEGDSNVQHVDAESIAPNYAQMFLPEPSKQPHMQATTHKRRGSDRSVDTEGVCIHDQKIPGKGHPGVSGEVRTEYQCNYCGCVRTSASAGSDGRVRIRCECGGRHRDQKSRMHAM